MQPMIGKPGRRALWLALALTASVIQVLGSSLPSLVVCQKVDRPPRIEFFSDSCSCRQKAIHSYFDQNGNGVFRFGETCTDIFLQSHALLAAAARRQCHSANGTRRTLGPERHSIGSGFLCPQPMPGCFRALKAEPPPSLSLSRTNSRLRC
jgi:hypothetical protein